MNKNSRGMCLGRFLKKCTKNADPQARIKKIKKLYFIKNDTAKNMPA